MLINYYGLVRGSSLPLTHDASQIIYSLTRIFRDKLVQIYYGHHGHYLLSIGARHQYSGHYLHPSGCSAFAEFENVCSMR